MIAILTGRPRPGFPLVLVYLQRDIRHFLPGGFVFAEDRGIMKLADGRVAGLELFRKAGDLSHQPLLVLPDKGHGDIQDGLGRSDNYGVNSTVSGSFFRNCGQIRAYSRRWRPGTGRCFGHHPPPRKYWAVIPSPTISRGDQPVLAAAGVTETIPALRGYILITLLVTGQERLCSLLKTQRDDTQLIISSKS